ncbi:MAG TPA: penicillin acylase family protein, partial [Steroidobacteraceae bacterium]
MSFKRNGTIRAGRCSAAIIGLLALCICLGAAAAQAGDSGLRERGRQTEILWDKFAIPSIYGKDVRAVLQGYGYAQMENHAELLLQQVATARGRSAEFFGPGEGDQNVSSDILVLTNDIPGRARTWYLAGGEEQRTYLNAFVSGINLYAALHGDTISSRFRRVLPVTPADILANFQLIVQFGFMPAASNVGELLQSFVQGAAVPAALHTSGILRKRPNGSNGWA